MRSEPKSWRVWRSAPPSPRCQGPVRQRSRRPATRPQLRTQALCTRLGGRVTGGGGRRRGLRQLRGLTRKRRPKHLQLLTRSSRAASRDGSDMSAHGRLALLTAFAVGLPGVAAHAAVKFDGANVFTGGTVAVAIGSKEKDNSGQNSDMTKSAQHSIDAPLTVSIKEGKGSTLASAYNHQDAYAEFYNKRSGAVDFSGNTIVSAASIDGAAEAFDSGTSFNYDFTLTSTYDFNVEYSYAETPTFAMVNYFQLINTAGGAPLFAFSPANGTYANPQTGSATYTLGPGSYEFGAVTKLGDFAFAGGPGTAAGSHAEHYDFDLSAVSAVPAAPEPGTWALMSAGVAMLGAMLRFGRRREGAALAA